MKTAEEYAVELVAEGAQSYAEADIDEDCELGGDTDNLRKAIRLACDMARTVGVNPEAFRAWYEQHREEKS